MNRKPTLSKLTKRAKLKIKKRTTSQRKHDLHEKWAKIIKHRAGWKSELSGSGGIMNAHHIARKPNYYLRFSLDNGICITQGEHKFGVHGERAEEYRAMIIQKIGQERWDRLHALRSSAPLMTFDEAEMMLDKELAKYQNKEGV